MGQDVSDKEFLKRFIGPPLHDEWQQVYGFSPEEAAEAVRLFREFFSVYGWWDNELYDGIPEMLNTLKNRGKYIVLTTSKPEVFARKILELFDIAKYFDFIGGASTDRSRDKKWQVIEYVFENIGLRDRSRAILVGDRKYDAEGAALTGIDSLGVLYGHGSEEEIRTAGFTYVVSGVDDISELII
jgi:phosphoglycolate phosphatase